MQLTPHTPPPTDTTDPTRAARILVRLPEELRRKFYVACRLNGRSANATLLLLIEEHITNTQHHCGATIGIPHGTTQHTP
jgi:hypothetical protein